MRLFTIILCCFCNVAYTQNKGLAFVKDTKPENCINLSFTPQWYLNKGGVHNDGSEPEVISANNTQGYVIGIEYERVTKYGLVINAGLHYGRQNHTVGINYRNLKFFDSINQEQLGAANFNYTYKGDVGYIGWRYMMGCQWKLGKTFLKDCKIELKAGIACRISVTENYQDGIWRFAYPRNDTLYITSFGNDGALLGRASTLGNFLLSYNAELYLGLKKNISLLLMKHFSLGLLVTHSGFGKDWGGVAFVHADSKNFAGKVISQDFYRSQDFSFGVKMAVGLWY